MLTEKFIWGTAPETPGPAVCAWGIPSSFREQMVPAPGSIPGVGESGEHTLTHRREKFAVISAYQSSTEFSIRDKKYPGKWEMRGTLKKVVKYTSHKIYHFSHFNVHVSGMEVHSRCLVPRGIHS